MKNITILFLLITSFAFSQVESKLGNFNKVTSFDAIDVLLVKSDENSISINGNDAESVETIIKNGELKIRMPLGKTMTGDNITATVFYVDINAIEANEGSRIACETVIKSNNFDIKVKEGAKIKVKLEVKNLVARVANGGEINIEGNATKQDVLTNSGGIYSAEKFITETTIITANAGGEADVYATDFVEAKVRAGGDITIYGKPKEINQKVVLGGNIQEAK